MAKIPEDIETRVQNELSVIDALQEIGASPTRRGAAWECRNPFREDKHIGSFKINERANYAKDFSTDDNGMGKKTYSAIDILMQGLGLSYHDALRHGAAMLHIYIDDSEPVNVKRVCKPVAIQPKTKLMLWTADVIAKPFKQYNDFSPLLGYLRKLPLSENDKPRLERAINNYCVGTYPQGTYAGWTIWWYIDDHGYVRSGKMMAYKSDGHREKEQKPNFTWVHSLLERQGKFNRDTHHVEFCFFGQHLIEFCLDAVIRLVESEKTAVICSAFNNPKEVLYLASGGLSMMSDDKLLYLLKKGRQVELLPDMDGYEKWEAKIHGSEKLKPYIENGYLKISDIVKQLWKPEDGEKADIADIMIRIVTTPRVTLGMKVAAQLGAPEKAEVMDQFINALGLVEI